MNVRVLVVGLVIAVPALASAADLPCGPVEPGAISLDGMTDDWSEVAGADAGGQDSNLSFTIKCNVDPGALYLLVDVRDNYFARTRQSRSGEDHIELTLGGRRLMVYPGDNNSIKDKLFWAPGRPAKGIKMAAALQQHGWAVELRVPLAQVPGYRRGAPGIRVNAQVDDCDSKASLKTERSIAFAGNIAFAEAESALDAFLKEQGLTRSSIYFDRQMATGRGAGARSLVIGKYLVFVSDEYVYQELPFKDRRDLKDARLVDLAGDGRDALVMRYTERGRDGTREVLAAYRPDATQIARVFACEVGKSDGAAKFQNKVSFVRRGRATDVLVEAGEASNISRTSYREPGDMLPALLPGEERRARYEFSGNEYRRAQ